MNREVLWLDCGETGDHWIVVDEVITWMEGDGETKIGFRNGELIAVSGMHGAAIAKAVTGQDWKRPQRATAGAENVDANGAPV